MARPVIFQVVGFQNSGKTTVTARLIEELSAENYTAAAIKHHGHGGKPEIYEQKDSSRLIRAGAVASLVEGEGRLLLQADNQTGSLSEKIQLLSFFKPDFLLVEGHKHEGFPKAVLIRNLDDAKLLTELPNIKVILCQDEQLIDILSECVTVPVFHTEDRAVAWIIDYLKKHRNFT